MSGIITTFAAQKIINMNDSNDNKEINTAGEPIKNKVYRQDEIHNEETLAAMRDAENGVGLSKVDTSNVDAMIASFLK